MPWVHRNRGLVLLQQDRLPAALAALSRAVYLDPDDVDSRRSRTTALERLGDTAWLAAERSILGD